MGTDESSQRRHTISYSFFFLDVCLTIQLCTCSTVSGEPKKKKKIDTFSFPNVNNVSCGIFGDERKRSRKFQKFSSYNRSGNSKNSFRKRPEFFVRSFIIYIFFFLKELTKYSLLRIPFFFRW